MQPVSADWGFDRGQPVDRYYIENFLAREASRVRGDCLEMANSNYTRRFGGSRVHAVDVLDIDLDNREASIHGDLTIGGTLAPSRYDCFILTQTLQHLYDTMAALGHAYGSLKPGGTLLISVPTLVKHLDEPRDYWRFTDQALRRLLQDACRKADIWVECWGNLTACTAFLHGLAAAELTQAELDYRDPDFPLTVCAVATKPPAG